MATGIDCDCAAVIHRDNKCVRQRLEPGYNEGHWFRYKACLSLSQNSQPLDLTEALAQLFRTLRPVQDTQTVALADAVGRIVAAEVVAPVSLPPFRASAMDGYALRKDDLAQHPDGSFRVVGESLAGHPFAGHLDNMECVRVFTGALVPDDCDQVFLQEQTEVLEDSVRFTGPIPGQSYIRGIGHDIVAGTCLSEPNLMRLIPAIWPQLVLPMWLCTAKFALVFSLLAMNW